MILPDYMALEQCIKKQVAAILQGGEAIAALGITAIEQNKRITELEAALCDMARCLIDGKVDVDTARPDTEFHRHRILGPESVQTIVEVYHQLKGTSKSVNERSVAFIVRYGGIDGEHHKQWVLDQVLRILAGTAYDEIIARARQDDYSWSEGIAP